MVILLIPKRLNRSNSGKDEEEEEESSEGKKPETKVTIRMIITNKRAMIATILEIFTTIFLLFVDTILSDRILEMGVSEHLTGKIFQLFKIFSKGYIFSISCVVYTISCPLVGIVFKKYHRIYIL